MGWTSYRAEGTRKEEALKVFERFGNVEYVTQQGTTFYALLRTEEGRQWVLALLTSMEKDHFFDTNVFYYKDIQVSLYETVRVPKTILKRFVPYDKESQEWVNKCYEWWKATEPLKVKAGQVWTCTAPYSLSWDGGLEFEKQEPFEVLVVKNAQTNRLYYSVVGHTGYRITSKAFKHCTKTLKE